MQHHGFVARALWTGVISFGLVSVPVKLYKATPSSSAHGISFHRLHAACGTRIAHVRRCPACEVDVAWEDVVNGYEFARGRYAIIRREELPGPERGEEAAIAIEDFVTEDQVPPLLYDHAYWIAPEGNPKAYALLHKALVETGRLAIARVVVRTRSHLAAVRAEGTHLVLSTMFFNGEVVDEHEVPSGAEGVAVTQRELDLAKELVERMSVPFEHGRYEDTTTARLRELIEDKIAAKQIAAPAAVEMGEAEVVDIMDALRRSVERAAVKRAEEAGTDASDGDRNRAGRRRRSALPRSSRAVRKGRGA